ncbi:MAG: hypothetical protein HS107_06965 [Thermoflexaceae bacterium]|nr:hypothetical protein [Thermoflexaceae bacterium]
MAGECGQCDHEHADAEQGHGGCEHGGEAFLPPEQPFRLVPEFPMLWRGLAFAGIAAGAAVGAVMAVRQAPLLAIPVAPVAGFAGVLAAWAAAIHLTGGERFDDNPFV